MPATKAHPRTSNKADAVTTRSVSSGRRAASKKKKVTAASIASLDKYQLKDTLDELEPRDLWDMYRAEPTEPVRNYLIERFLPLVRYNAERIYTRLPDEVDIDDLMSVGLFGLMDAIKSFDQDRGVKFETFCAPRIRGAILDHLRYMDWVPRLVRNRSSQVERIRARRFKESGTKVTEEEITEELGVSEDEVKKILRDGSAVQITSLSRQRYQSDGNREVREIDVLTDKRASDPLLDIQRGDLKHLLCKGLTRAERLIIILYYYEEMTMKEIGATLDLSESRVSQMHSSILARLKAQLQHRERELEETAVDQG